MPKKASNANTTNKAESTSSTASTALTANNAEEVAKEVVKSQKGTYRNSPVIGAGQELFASTDEKREFTKRVLSSIIKNWNSPIVKTDEEAEERIDSYFSACAEEGRRPTVEELALILGTTRSTIYKWETGELKTISGNIIKKAKEVMASFDAATVSENKMHPTAYIFRAKNYYGMKDTQDINIKPVQPLGAEEATEKIEQKYAESIIDTTGTDVDG